MSTLNTFIAENTENSPVKNKRLISVIFDTSHSAIMPCGLPEQLLLADRVRHSLMALSRSLFDFGENALVVTHTVADIEPDDPANISFLIASE